MLYKDTMNGVDSRRWFAMVEQIAEEQSGCLGGTMSCGL
jgi:hypothetical protein